MVNAADAPIIPKISGGCSGSADNTVNIIWTSLCKLLGNNGRMDRSVNLQDSIASAAGLPSLLKKLPGILPAEYSLSSNSTVNGRKSISGRALSAMTAVANTTVSPRRTTTDPCA